MLESESYDKWEPLYEGVEKIFEQPIVLEAEVVHGFQRGSKELGIPTANMCMEQLGEKGDLSTGIYFGWTILKGTAYPSVVSVGWNPFYQNSKKTIEIHILQELEDFYGETIKTMFLGYLRQETNFNGVEELISCIHSDIFRTKRYLSQPNLSKYELVENWP